MKDLMEEFSDGADYLRPNVSTLFVLKLTKRRRTCALASWGIGRGHDQRTRQRHCLQMSTIKVIRFPRQKHLTLNDLRVNLTSIPKTLISSDALNK